jgi:hypothetical protein
MTQINTEAVDQKQVEDLIFNPHGLTLQKIKRGLGRSPDFQVLLNGTPVAYCELKSPQDDWLDKLLDQAKPCEIVGGARNDPVFNRIQRLTNKAATQFQSINPNRVLPNILCFVNHDNSSSYADLREIFTGFFHTSDGSRHLTMPHVASGLSRAKQEIDVCIWINSLNNKIEGYLFNQNATPSFLSQVCNLLGQSLSNIKH